MRIVLVASTVLVAVSAAALPARAGYIVTFSQVGHNVVATGAGTLDTNDLSLMQTTATNSSFVTPDLPGEVTGVPGMVDAFIGNVSGPAQFGTADLTATNHDTGDSVGLAFITYGAPIGSVLEVFVPHGYVSGAPLADTATYANHSFADLGLTIGSYVYNFGSGASADTFTIDVGTQSTPVPEPSSLALLGGLLGIGLIIKWRLAGRPYAASCLAAVL